MIHLDDGVLRAWMDRELAPDDGRDVKDHVEGCGDCRARVRELRRAESVVQEALALLDAPVPGAAAWARVSAGLAAPAVHRPVRSAPGGRHLARAAGFVLLVGGGVAAAVIPGSPLRSLWDSAPATTAPEGAPALAADAPPARAGVRATDEGGPVRVAIDAPRGTEVQIVLTGRRAGVFGPASSTFSTGEGWLRAELDGGPARVELPATGASARIEVNGSPAVIYENGRLTAAPDDAVEGEGEIRLRFQVR